MTCMTGPCTFQQKNIEISQLDEAKWCVQGWKKAAQVL